MEALLAKRIDQMKDGGTDDAPTDQYRAFSYIVEQLEHGNQPLRLMIQASAGTGQSPSGPTRSAFGAPAFQNTSSQAPNKFKQSVWRLIGLETIFLLTSRDRSGKSFLLTSVFLWCILHGKKAKACAPTGFC